MDAMRILVNRTLAINEGVDEQRALELGLIGAMLPTPAVGYVLTIATARREAPPPPSAEVPEGSIRVPDVTAMPLTEAEKKLKPTGLDMEKVEKKSTVFAPGVVMAEEPPAGTMVTAGSTVFLTVSKG